MFHDPGTIMLCSKFIFIYLLMFLMAKLPYCEIHVKTDFLTCELCLLLVLALAPRGLFVFEYYSLFLSSRNQHSQISIDRLSTFNRKKKKNELIGLCLQLALCSINTSTNCFYYLFYNLLELHLFLPTSCQLAVL